MCFFQTVFKNIDVFCEVFSERATVAPSLKYPREEFQLGSQPNVIIFLALALPSTAFKDLANQIRHWEVYTKEVEKVGGTVGKYLSPSAAEWFSGGSARFLCFT